MNELLTVEFLRMLTSRLNEIDSLFCSLLNLYSLISFFLLSLFSFRKALCFLIRLMSVFLNLPSRLSTILIFCWIQIPSCRAFVKDFYDLLRWCYRVEKNFLNSVISIWSIIFAITRWLSSSSQVLCLLFKKLISEKF